MLAPSPGVLAPPSTENSGSAPDTCMAWAHYDKEFETDICITFFSFTKVFFFNLVRNSRQYYIQNCKRHVFIYSALRK